MNRTTFIKNILALGGLAFIPKQFIKEYKKFYLLQCFVAGFRFGKGMDLLENMKEGDMLELVREPNNEFDNCAIALHWNKQKIGYIPRSENEILSKLLDANALELMAEIAILKKDTKPWENVFAAIYFLKESNDAVLANAAYLTVLDTPHYRSYKQSNDVIKRVTWSNLNDKNVFVENDTDWYHYFETYYPNDRIYDILHNDDFTTYNNIEYGKDGNEYLLVNKKRIPKEFKLKNIINEAEQICGELNELFNEDGYIVMTTKEAEALVPKINKLVHVTDKLGQHYIEMCF